MSDGGCVVVARDVTTRKQIDDEKADFLATVSHELRTPLTPIKGFLQTLLRRDTEFTEEERRHIYTVMLREEGRLERLVHQLLQATSLEHVEKLLMPEAVDWAAAAAHQVDVGRRQEPDREISLIVAPTCLASSRTSSSPVRCWRTCCRTPASSHRRTATSASPSPMTATAS